MLPSMLLKTTTNPIGRGTKNSAHHAAQHNILPSKLPDCGTKNALKHATQLAAQHKTLHIIRPASTQYTAQHNMQCNMLPSWPPNTKCSL